MSRGRAVLRGLAVLRVNDRVLEAAGLLLPVALRSLDAIHLATARELGDELGSLVTYDDRLAEAARALGHRVAGPR